MRRRELLALLGGAALLGPRATRAQTPGRIYHLGTLNPSVAGDRDQPIRKGPGQGAALSAATFSAQNLTFDARGAMGDVAKLPTLLQELKARDVDAIVVVGYPAALAAKSTGNSDGRCVMVLATPSKPD